MPDTPRPRQRAVIDGPGLRLGAAFLATTTAAGNGDAARDPLISVASARRWADGALAEFGTAAGSPATPVTLGRDDLEPLRTFREWLRAALRADGPAPEDVGPPAGYSSAIQVRWDPIAGASYASTEDGWRALSGLLTVELLRAEAAGTRHRLKTCAYDPCGAPFIDQSPSASRLWHDTKRCGNLVNLRASRARGAGEVGG